MPSRAERSPLRLLACTLALAIVPPPLHAQSAADRLAPGPGSVPAQPPPVDGPASAAGVRGEVGATLASAVLPGTGQLLQGRRRGVLFLAAEAVAWGLHLDARSDGRNLRNAYRDLAWSIARGAPEPRVDGPFEYYERLAHWDRSGAYDADPQVPDVQPERDPATYNGRQWRLAADLWLGGDVEADPGTPGYDEALGVYRSRAYTDPFTWDWTGAPAEQGRFSELIEKSDSRFQAAGLALAAVVANHVFAAVEAFVFAREARDEAPTVRFVPDAVGGRWSLQASIALPGGVP